MQLGVVGAFNQLYVGGLQTAPQEGAARLQRIGLGGFIARGQREATGSIWQGLEVEPVYESIMTLAPGIGKGRSSLGGKRASLSISGIVELARYTEDLQFRIFDEVQTYDLVLLAADHIELIEAKPPRIPSPSATHEFWPLHTTSFHYSFERGSGEGRTITEKLPYVSLIWGLIENDQISAARRLLDTLPSDALDEPRLRTLRRVLAPPKVSRRSTTDVDRSQEYQWLRAHGQQYRGKWVAVEGDRLIAAAETLKELLEDLKGLDLPRRPLLHRLG